MPSCSSPPPCRALCPFLGREQSRFAPEEGLGAGGRWMALLPCTNPGAAAGAAGEKGNAGRDRAGGWHLSHVTRAGCLCQGWKEELGALSRWEWQREPQEGHVPGGMGALPYPQGLAEGGSANPRGCTAAGHRSQTLFPFLGAPKELQVLWLKLHKDSQGFAFCSLSMPELP